MTYCERHTVCTFHGLFLVFIMIQYLLDLTGVAQTSSLCFSHFAFTHEHTQLLVLCSSASPVIQLRRHCFNELISHCVTHIVFVVFPDNQQ